MVYYAVAVGMQVGVYNSWSECEQQVKGFKGAKFKKFKTLQEANAFIQQFAQAATTSTVAAASIAETYKNVKRSKGALSACHDSKQYLANKIKMEVDEVKAAPIKVKQEAVEYKFSDALCPDYIPLTTAAPDMKVNVKTEIDLETSLFFEDTEGDQELLQMLALPSNNVHNAGSTRTANSKSTDKNGTVSQPKTTKFGKLTFMVDNEDYIIVHICGHSENVGNWNCSAGFGVYFGDDHELNVCEPATGRITSNVGDIEAAVYVVRTTGSIGLKKVCVHTNSEFLLNAITRWMYKWKNNDWRNQAGKVVQNRKELERLDRLINENAQMMIKWNLLKDKSANNSKAAREARKLAELGNEEYLLLHPNKEMDHEFANDFAFDFDFY